MRPKSYGVGRLVKSPANRAKMNHDMADLDKNYFL